jgi:2-keto-3-deoxy-L-rhamnonate aldolase RhmA
MMRKKGENRSFKKLLESGKPQFGTFVKIFSVELIEILGLAGLDFIVVDMEHTTLEFRQVEQMVRVAELYGMYTIVRIPDASRSSVLRALDLGATGIQVPQINHADEVKEVVDKAKYPPLGSRGVTYAHRAAKFGFTPENYLEEANEQSVIVLHIETESAYDEVEKICNVVGIDVVFIGPLDLSVSLGMEADYLKGELAVPVRHILDVCRKKGKKAGIAVSNEEQCLFAIQQNVPYIVWSSDVALFKQAVDGIVKMKNLIHQNQ